MLMCMMVVEALARGRDYVMMDPSPFAAPQPLPPQLSVVLVLFESGDLTAKNSWQGSQQAS